MLSIFQNPLLLGLPVSLYAQSIPLAFPEGPNNFLNNQYGQNDQLYNYLYGHGCFCSKIFDITADYNDASLRGGTQPVDEMDRICMKWLRTRDCDSNLLGGECYNVDLDTRSYDSSDCSSLSDGCDQNACLIDEFYRERFEKISCLIGPRTQVLSWCVRVASLVLQNFLSFILIKLWIKSVSTPLKVYFNLVKSL